MSVFCRWLYTHLCVRKAPPTHQHRHLLLLYLRYFLETLLGKQGCIPAAVSQAAAGGQMGRKRCAQRR